MEAEEEAMSIHWTLTLSCSNCYASIRYEDERPEWVSPDVSSWDVAEREAMDFAARYPVLSGFLAPWTAPDGTKIETLPPLVHRDFLSGKVTALPQTPPPDHVVCPACNGCAYPIDATAPAPEDAVKA